MPYACNVVQVLPAINNDDDLSVLVSFHVLLLHIPYIEIHYTLYTSKVVIVRHSQAVSFEISLRIKNDNELRVLTFTTC